MRHLPKVKSDPPQQAEQKKFSQIKKKPPVQAELNIGEMDSI